MTVRVGCAQVTPEKGDVSGNIGRIADAINQCAEQGCDIVTFAETAVSGYILEGGVLECALEAGALAELLCQRVGKLHKPIDAVVGFYEIHSGQVHNSAAYIEFSDGVATVLSVYRKFFLATYGVFDEDRFVARGRELGLIETRFGKIGILVCEDVWHSLMPSLLALAGAQILIVPSASPARGFDTPEIGNLARYGRMLKSCAEEHGIFAVNCQLTGFEGGKGLVGGSSIYDPFGNQIGQSPVQEDHLLVVDCDFDLIQIARQNTPLLADMKGHWDDVKRIAGELEV